MGPKVIELALKNRKPIFQPNQYTLCQGVVRRQSDATPIVAVTSHPLPGRETLEGSRAVSRILRRAGLCVLGLLIGAAADQGLCSEINLSAPALGGSSEQARKITTPSAMRDDSLVVSQADKERRVEQKQVGGREQIDGQQLDAVPSKAAQSAAARERKLVVERDQEWGKAEALARALTSSLRGQVAAVRSAAEAERINQHEAIDRERDRANALARELDSLKAELDRARRVSEEAAQGSEAEVKRREALEQEQGRADSLARQVASLQSELDAERSKGAKTAQAAAAAESKQREELEQERGRADGLARQVTSLQSELDAERSKGAKTAQAAAAASKQREALEQERSRADSLARQVTSLGAELDAERRKGAKATQSAAAESKLREALEQERGRADSLARQVTSLQSELDAERSKGANAAQSTAAEIKQKEALEQERGRADSLEGQVTSLRAELEAARKLVAKAAQAAEVSEQKQALEKGLKQEQDRTVALASELTSVRAELDQARAASLAAERAARAVKTEQQKERANTETLARELDSARKQAEERSALLAAAHAEALQVKGANGANATEQKLALASERDRADALGRELNSVRNQLEADHKQIGALNALLSQRSSKPVAEFSSTTDEEGRSKEQIPGAAAASPAGSSVAESARPRAQTPSPPPASDLARSPPASAVTHSPVDEQRLLARANAMLQQADISGARPLLEHAVEHGSARAAYMLAETYDVRVLQAWRARGISGDPTKARQLYERAQAGGIEDAKGRIEALQ